MNLKERTVNISRLTQNQQKVMAKILAAPTPLVAFSEISSGPNLIAARDILQKLGLIDFKEDESAEVTDTGMQILRSLNIVDDMDELTDEGRNMAYDQDQQPPMPAPEPDMGGMEPSPMESFSLIKKINFLAEGRMKDIAIDVHQIVTAANTYDETKEAIKTGNTRFLKKFFKDHFGFDDMSIDLAISKLLKQKNKLH